MFGAYFSKKPKGISLEPESEGSRRILGFHPILVAGHALRTEAERAEFLLREQGLAEVYEIPQARSIRDLRLLDDHSIAIHILMNLEISLRLHINPPTRHHQENDQNRSRARMPSMPSFGVANAPSIGDASHSRLRRHRDCHQPEHPLLIRPSRKADSPPYPSENADDGSRHHPLA